MDNIFSFKVILRFVLPGLTVLLAGWLLIESWWQNSKDASFIADLALTNQGWPAFFWVASLAFVIGIILNAALFEFGYEQLGEKYEKENSEAVRIENRVFGAVMQSFNFSKYNVGGESTNDRVAEEVLSRGWADLCENNKRGIVHVFDKTGAVESLRDEFAPYIDLQVGLAFGLSFLSISFGVWLASAGDEYIKGIDLLILGGVICSTLLISARVLWISAYKNYRKLRQSRLVMLAALMEESVFEK